MTKLYFSSRRRDEPKDDAPHEQPGEEQQPDSAALDALRDLPAVKVGEITLDIEDVRARVSLIARVGDLVSLDDAGEAFLEELKGSSGDEARALLEGRLQKVYASLEQAVGKVGSDMPEFEEPATPQPHSRARHVRRRIAKVARTCAAEARRAVQTARLAVRARREAKAAHDVT
jgi:hypothetical protein